MSSLSALCAAAGPSVILVRPQHQCSGNFLHSSRCLGHPLVSVIGLIDLAFLDPMRFERLTDLSSTRTELHVAYHLDSVFLQALNLRKPFDQISCPSNHPLKNTDWSTLSRIPNLATRFDLSVVSCLRLSCCCSPLFRSTLSLPHKTGRGCGGCSNVIAGSCHS